MIFFKKRVVFKYNNKFLWRNPIWNEKESKNLTCNGWDLYLGKSQEDMLSYFSLIDGKINPSDREQPLNCIEPFKCALISDFFFTLAQISKLRYRITVLSTINLKRICLVIWHLFWRFESKWKTFRYLKEIDLSF